MKKLLAVALTLSAVTALSACGSKPIDVEVLEDFTKDVTIEFTHVSGDDTTLKAIYEEVKEDFEKEFPRVTVNLTYVEGSYNGLIDHIENSIIKENQPNVTIGYPGNFIEYAAGYQGTAVANLDQFIEHETHGLTDEDIKDFKDAGFWAEGQSYDAEGTTYSLPFGKSSEAFYVNAYIAKQGMTALGKETTDAAIKTQVATWDGVFELAKALKELNNSAIPYEMHHDTSANLAITIFQQFKGVYLSQENKFDFTNDSLNTVSKEAVQYLKDNQEYIQLRDGNNYGSGVIADASKTPTAWANIGSTSCQNYYASVTDLLILPVPQMTTSSTDTTYNQYAYLQGPSLCLLSNTDQDENLAAWIFMKYLTAAETSSKIAMASGYMPVRASCYDAGSIFDTWLKKSTDESKIDAQEACKVAMSQIDWYSPDPVFVGSDSGRDEAGVLINNALGTSGMTVAQAFAKAKENLELI